MSDYPVNDGVIKYKNFEVPPSNGMNQVIELLERQLRIEEMAITSNNIERGKRAAMIGYKGPALYPENPDYVEQLKKAIEIIQPKQLT